MYVSACVRAHAHMCIYINIKDTPDVVTKNSCKTVLGKRRTDVQADE